MMDAEIERMEAGQKDCRRVKERVAGAWEH